MLSRICRQLRERVDCFLRLCKLSAMSTIQQNTTGCPVNCEQNACTALFRSGVVASLLQPGTKTSLKHSRSDVLDCSASSNPMWETAGAAGRVFPRGMINTVPQSKVEAAADLHIPAARAYLAVAAVHRRGDHEAAEELCSSAQNFSSVASEKTDRIPKLIPRPSQGLEFFQSPHDDYGRHTEWPLRTLLPTRNQIVSSIPKPGTGFSGSVQLPLFNWCHAHCARSG